MTVLSSLEQNSAEVAFFGYGSLVNELTWPRVYEREPAEIQNWVRAWKHCVDTPFGRVCALTATRSTKKSIQGVFITCRFDELADLDQREIGYERIQIAPMDVVSA